MDQYFRPLHSSSAPPTTPAAATPGTISNTTPAESSTSPALTTAASQATGNDRAIQLEVGDIQFGYLEEDDPTGWPRKARLKTGQVVELQLVKLSAKEKGVLFIDGDVPASIAQIQGTNRGDSKCGVCLLCWNRVTIPKDGRTGTGNLLSHLRGKDCCQPAGKDRANAVLKVGAVSMAATGAGPRGAGEWSFLEKLPHHVKVAQWIVFNARPFFICEDAFLIQHELAISGGGYRLPSQQTVRRLVTIMFD